MNPLPFDKYKEQAYSWTLNSSEQEPLRLKLRSRRASLPGTPDSNPTKVSTLKRKFSCSQSPTRYRVDKKKKMAGEELKEILKIQTEEFKRVLVDHKEEIKKSVSDSIKPIKDELTILNEKCDQMEESNAQRDLKVESIKEEMRDLKENLKDEVKRELEKELKGAREMSHKIFLMKEIEKANCNIVIHGMKTTNIESEVKNFIGTMPHTKSLEIKKVQQLGKGRDDKPSSILVTFLNEFQRNTLLRGLSNLPKGVYIERDIPTNYREEYKRFRREAWKYKQFFEVHTQIIFNSHIMQLRYKEDKKDFTILKEYFPKVDDVLSSTSAISHNISSLPSLSINAESIESAKKCLIMTGIRGETETSLKERLGAILTPKKMEGIVDIRIQNQRAKLTCKTSNIAKSLLSATKGKQLGDFHYNVSGFSE